MKNIFKKIFHLPKKILIPAILLIAFLVWNFAFKNQNQKPFAYDQAKQQDLKVEVSTSGILSGQSVVNLHFNEIGKLSYLKVAQGDQVKEGETIAGLDTQALSIALQQAKNTLSSDQAALEKVYDDIHLSQYGNGGFSNVGSANETEAQKATREEAEAASNSAYDAVKAAERAFQDAVLTSPISGVVTQTGPLPGQNVSLTDTVAQIVDFSRVEFDADVDESDIGSVSIGQRAEVTLNAYGDKIFYGTVSEIVPETKTTSNGATVVTVKIPLADPNLKHIQGLNGQVNIITAENPNALTIPLEDLREDNTVLIKTDQGVHARKVVPGLKNDTDVEIISGLNLGDQVVKDPPSGNYPS